MPKQSFFLPDLSTVQIRNRGHLPHWEMPNAVYSITFRLADSLPAHVVERLREERAALRRRADTAADRISQRRLFERRIDDCLDSGAGACHLRDERIARMVADALRYFDGSRYELIAWCVMPNHVHVVMHVLGTQSLASILHSWKSYSSKQANRILRREGEFWMREYFDRIIRDDDDLSRTIAYVLANPAKAGLVDWKWVWSAGETPA
jgi:menaquinone-specific isochorismate synthase